jgi:hypothetical protein
MWWAATTMASWWFPWKSVKQLQSTPGRSKLHQRVGLAPDDTIDYETVEAYYRQFE